MEVPQIIIYALNQFHALYLFHVFLDKFTDFLAVNHEILLLDSLQAISQRLGKFSLYQCKVWMSSNKVLELGMI